MLASLDGTIFGSLGRASDREALLGHDWPFLPLAVAADRYRDQMPYDKASPAIMASGCHGRGIQPDLPKRHWPALVRITLSALGVKRSRVQVPAARRTGIVPEIGHDPIPP